MSQNATCEPPLSLNLMSTYGALLIGTVFSFALWGVACLQTFLYFVHYNRDHYSLKLLVFWIWGVDTAHTMLLLAGLFPPLILKYGSVAALLKILAPTIHHVWVSAVLTVSVQLFYLYRISRLCVTKSLLTRIPLIVMTTLCVWEVAGAILYGVWTLPLPTSDDLYGHRIVSLETSLRTVTASVDIAIAVWMSVLLIQQRRPHHRSTNRMIFHLIVVTVITGMWTAVIAVVDLLLITASPNNFIYGAFELPLASLYANSLLGNLNVRSFLHSSQDIIDFDDLTFSWAVNGGNSISLQTRVNRAGSSQHPATTDRTHDHAVAIRINTSTAVQSDGDSTTGMSKDEQLVEP